MGLVVTWTFVNRINAFITPLDLQNELFNGGRERVYARGQSSQGARGGKLLPQKTQGRYKMKASKEILFSLLSFWSLLLLIPSMGVLLTAQHQIP
jgi:hypothetical protein